jgi:hypothetical protein
MGLLFGQESPLNPLSLQRGMWRQDFFTPRIWAGEEKASKASGFDHPSLCASKLPQSPVAVKAWPPVSPIKRASGFILTFPDDRPHNPLTLASSFLSNLDSPCKPP